MNTIITVSRQLTGLAFAAAFFVAITPAVGKPAAFSPERISELVEPIALYPDPLLQQILPACTFPDQIADAALLVRNKTDAEQIKDQQWDESVKIIATYPGVLKMMYQKLDWTTDLGNAFLEQHEEVLNSIQELRAKAKAQGNLKSSEHQKVDTKSEGGNNYITIQPSDPQVVYVPQETTSTVYTQPVDTTANVLVPMATFGLGLALGGAWSDDDHDEYYYGGPWGGGMWGSSDSFDHWVDTRHDTFEDMRGQAANRQDFRQGQRAERQDYRQEWAKDNPAQANQARQNFQANQGQRQQKAAERRQNPAQGQGNLPAQRQQQLSEARASMNTRGFEKGQGAAQNRAAGAGQGSESRGRGQLSQNRPGGGQAGQARSGGGQLAQNRGAGAGYSRPSGGGAWGGTGGSGFANRSSNRGASSLSGAGRGGGSFGGGRGMGGGRGGRR